MEEPTTWRGRGTYVVPLQALAAIQVTALGWFLGKQVADAKHIHDLGTVALDWRADFFPHRHRAGADRTRAAKCGGGADVWPWAGSVVNIMKSASPWVGSGATNVTVWPIESD